MFLLAKLIHNPFNTILLHLFIIQELKKLARPEFAANPDKFYPTKTLKKLGFERNQCPKCQNYYWRSDPSRDTCGDSQCDEKYSFIGAGRGIGSGPDGKKITYGEAWKTFERSLTSARVPCTSIKRYPVVARWRDDVDFVQAGIYCFQPYCVTGELEPPANPLICPQFCMRFNDLDNIGITGRHYSGFIMLGIQVFNKPNDFKFWADECVEFNYRWLTEELKIDPKEITFIEDVWAGGGNLGPSIEYFVSGLEVGNMVFMQYKTFPDGSREPLQVQVIDVGIGLERIPWLVNGSATSYLDVFPSAFKYFQEKTDLKLDDAVWERFGPLSCLLNADESDDMDKTWQSIADKIGQPVKEVRTSIEPVRDAYVILDHLRTCMMAIQDGALPANTGGGSNIRNVLRRAFALLHKHNWFEKIGIPGILEICKLHQKDLAPIYGEFPPYSSFAVILQREYNLYCTHDVEVMKHVRNIIKKAGPAGPTLDDWIKCVTTYGVPEDVLAKECGRHAPGNLWSEIDNRQQQTMKMAAAVLYDTAHLKPTVSLYEDDHNPRGLQFTDSTVVEVFQSQTDKNKPWNIVVLDKSAFYPTSGGQDHDTGFLTIDGNEYSVTDVIRVGPCVLHTIYPPLPSREAGMGKKVSGTVDAARRDQLRAHHTATHLVFATCRKVLGPHIWQNGARKKVTEAHLDVTHYSSVTHDQILAIEQEVNRLVRAGKKITKNTQPKDVAEQKYGFTLYQGGVVPGNSLRIVDIADTDTEACCGTHCDSTSEVGIIKIIGARRVTDGVVRFTYVAGEAALNQMGRDSTLIHRLCTNLDTQAEHVVDTATNFFKDAIRFRARNARLSTKVLQLQLGLIVADPQNKLFVSKTEESTPASFFSELPPFIERLKANGQGVIFVGNDFIYAMLGNPDLLTTDKLKAQLVEWENRTIANYRNKLANEAAANEASANESKNDQGDSTGPEKSTSEAKDISTAMPPDHKSFKLTTNNVVMVAQGEGKKASKIKVNDVAVHVAFGVHNSSEMYKFFVSIGAVEI